MDRQRFPLAKRQWITITCSLLLLLLILIWLQIIAPILKKMPQDFTYTAHTLSVDNLYDEAAKKFQGAYISKTTFSYQVIGKKDNYLEVENQFVVQTLSNKPIISIKRLYFIDPYTWQHVNAPNQKPRIGYLFGPRYANKANFYYWHVNYDAPASLKFVDKEKIEGLTVNHYRANYSADQTAELAYLHNVPDKWIIRANINLQLWIEPISGWLVKYQDNTQSNYYDKKTGAYISPWNLFSNTYTQNSIREQVKKASWLKWKILLIDFGVPFLLLIIASLLLWIAFIPNQKKSVLNRYFSIKITKINASNVPEFIGILLIILSLIALYCFYLYQKSPPVFTIGIAQWNNNIDTLKTISGFKEGLAEYGFKEGKNLIFITNNSNSSIDQQINIIQSFLNKKVNLIFTLMTPGTLVAKGMTNKTPVVFSNVNYPEEDNIVDSAEESRNNLVGIRNYISLAQQFNAFEKIFPHTKTIGFVHHKGDPDSEIQYQQFKALLNDRKIQIVDIPAIDLSDLAQQLQRQDAHYDVLFLACDTLIQEGGGELVANYSKKNKIPNFSCDKGSIERGALMGIVADPYTIGILAGKKAALILLGAEPSWLRTEAPEYGYLFINTQTAQSIGITIPQSMLKQANHIIEEE